MNLDELVTLFRTRKDWPILAEHHCPKCKGTGRRVVARVIDVNGQPLYVSVQLDEVQHKAWVDLRRFANISGGHGPKQPPRVRPYYAIPDGTPQPAFCDRCGGCFVSP